ncbi:MAG: patatin-like phospholipase family protein, partial [Verrucomicrobia bacterium]|nr:patatin-like phospholipase family protein [Cytophagales bacterium]
MQIKVKSKYVRILSIDGGGIRNIIPAEILRVLEHKLQEKTGRSEVRLADYFDMIAGSGFGGIMACAYLSPLKPQQTSTRFSTSQVMDIFMRFGEKIFSDTLDHRILSLGGFLDEKYDADGLEEMLELHFDTLQLSHLLKPCVIPAYDISRREVHFFNKFKADKPARDFYVKDFAYATTAIPTLFECKKMQSLSGVHYAMIDGGMFANNPALCAYAEARTIFQQPNNPKKGVTATGMVVLSLGTGQPKRYYEFEEAKKWNLAGWARPLVDITSFANSEVVE